MIEIIDIEGFQAHKRLYLDFTENITTIVGKSDAGKSAIRRAIEWVCLNRPAGNEFLNWNSKKVSVTLTVDGVEIERRWEGNTNTYRMGDQLYKAFGRDVPQPIANFLSISDLNFQGQFDSPFWFSLSAGEVSRSLNKIVDLELMDSTMSNLASEIRKTQVLVDDREEALIAARSNRKNLRHIPRLKKDLDNVRKLSAIHQKHRQILDLSQKQVSEVEAITERYKTAAKVVRGAGICVTAGRKAAGLERKVSALRDLIGSVEEAEKKAAVKIPPVKALTVRFSRWNRREKQKKDLQIIIARTQRVRTDYDLNTDLLKEEKEKMKTKFKRCPLCGK